MRKSIVWLMSGMVIGGLVTAPVAAGAAGSAPLQVLISQVKLLVNGADRTPAGGTYWNGMAQVPFALEYEGTTYVPVRYFSNALGVPVNWDGSSRTIGLGSNPSASSAPVLQFGQSVQPVTNLPVTFTPLHSALYDTGDSNTMKVSVAVRNDDSKAFNFGAFQSQFVNKDGAEYSGTLYMPQGYDTQVDPKTARVLEFYATVPKGVAATDLRMQLTRTDFSKYPAQFVPFASVPLSDQKLDRTSYMGYDTVTFDLQPYHVQIGSINSWSYRYQTTTQIYKLHVTTTKDQDVNAFPNSSDLIFEVVDGNGQSVAQTRYAVGSTSNTAIPVLADGDQFLTFSTLDWSRYNSSGTKMNVYEAFGQGKRLLGTFALN